MDGQHPDEQALSVTYTQEEFPIYSGGRVNWHTQDELGVRPHPQIVIERVLPGARLPEHAGGDQHENVGLDFFAAEDVLWKVLTRTEYIGNGVEHNVPSGVWVAQANTGIRIKLPHGYHIQFAPRSGLAMRNNVLATCGIVDSSFRGIPMIQLICFDDNPPELPAGSKIAQGVVFRSLSYVLTEGEVDLNTTRGENGFGSTGK